MTENAEEPVQLAEAPEVKPGYSRTFQRCMDAVETSVRNFEKRVGGELQQHHARMCVVYSDRNGKLVVMGNASFVEAVQQSNAPGLLSYAAKVVPNDEPPAVNERDEAVYMNQRYFRKQPLLNPIARSLEDFEKLGKKCLLEKLVAAQEQVSGPGNTYLKAVPYWPAGVPYRRPDTKAAINTGAEQFGSVVQAVRRILEHLYAYFGYKYDGTKISNAEKADMIYETEETVLGTNARTKRKGGDQRPGKRQRQLTPDERNSADVPVDEGAVAVDQVDAVADAVPVQQEDVVVDQVDDVVPVDQVDDVVPVDQVDDVVPVDQVDDVVPVDQVDEVFVPVAEGQRLEWMHSPSVFATDSEPSSPSSPPLEQVGDVSGRHHQSSPVAGQSYLSASVNNVLAFRTEGDNSNGQPVQLDPLRAIDVPPSDIVKEVQMGKKMCLDHVDAVCDRLKLEYSDTTDGLHRMELICGESAPETDRTKRVVQLHHLTRRGHFVLSVAQANEDVVTVYDTKISNDTWHLQIDRELKAQLLQVYKSRLTRQGKLRVHISRNIEYQRDGWSCGHRCVAMAVDAIHGEEVGVVKYDIASVITSVRHLLLSPDALPFAPFGHQRTNRRSLQPIVIELCSKYKGSQAGCFDCLMVSLPDGAQEVHWTECQQCKCWFHNTCITIRKPLSATSVFHCSYCLRT